MKYAVLGLLALLAATILTDSRQDVVGYDIVRSDEAPSYKPYPQRPGLAPPATSNAITVTSSTAGTTYATTCMNSPSVTLASTGSVPAVVTFSSTATSSSFGTKTAEAQPPAQSDAAGILDSLSGRDEGDAR